MYILYGEESNQKSDMNAQFVAILCYSIQGISTFCIFKLIMVFEKLTNKSFPHI